MTGAFMGSAAPLSSLSQLRRFPYPHTPVAPPVTASLAPSKLQSSAVEVSPTTTTTTQTMPRHHTHHHPSLEVIGGACDSLLPALKSLNYAYAPFPLIGWNGHVETIFASFFRSVPVVRFRRECLRMKDGGTVALDWVGGDDRLLPADSPVLILVPGMTGGSGDSYVRHILIKARSKGWRAVVFNCRGCADSPVTTPQFYSASFIEDIRQVVAHVKKEYPKANLYSAGWSLGANILIQYLGQDSHICPLSGAISLCNPFNLVIANEDLQKGFNIIYDKNLAAALRKIFEKHALLFEDIGGNYNIPMAANAKSIKEFDDGITSISFGFKSADDYYANSGCSDSIKHVRTPLLCIQAANDPIAPSRAIPRDDIRANPNCVLIVTPKGGHLGWVAGDGAPCGASWTDEVVMEFLEHLEGAPSRVPAAAGRESLQPLKI